MLRIACWVLAVFVVTATPLDDYINKPEPDFAWRDTGKVVWPLAFGGKAHMLNVTSLRWLDESRAATPNGAVWSHQVAVVVPKKLTVKKAPIYLDPLTRIRASAMTNQLFTTSSSKHTTIPLSMSLKLFG